MAVEAPVGEMSPTKAAAGSGASHHHHEETELAVDERFLEHVTHPRNLGVLEHPSGQAHGVGVCGDSVEVAIRVEDDRIQEIRVQPHGCVYTVACASAVSELAQGRSIDEVLALGPEEVERVLGGLPEDHLHCARLAVNTLGEAVEDHYRRLHQKPRESQA